MLEHRALRPRGSQRPVGAPDDAEVVPNANPDIPPGTVGASTYEPGDPNGVEVVGDGIAARPFATVQASPWSGWPADWNTPAWGGRVNELVDVAWSCLDLNSSVISAMPPYLVGASPGLPVGWLENPDPDIYTSWEEFAKQLLWDYQMCEAFVLCTARYSNGFPARFHVVAPWMVNVDIVNGLREYSIGASYVPPDDILHIRYKSTAEDAHGHGPLEAGRYRVVAAGALLRYATTLVTSGGIPPGILEVEGSLLTANEATELQNQWHDAERLGRIRVASGGAKWRDVQLSPKDMSLAELEQMNGARIAVLMGVPPFLVGLPSGGDSLTYSTVTSLFDFHWRAGLRPKANACMRALSAWLTPNGTRLEVNRDEYVAPTPLERAQIARILHSIVTGAGDTERRAITIDEIRAGERLNDQSPAQLAEGVLR